MIQNLKERFGTKGNMGEGLDMPDVLDWFEKQGKQKHTPKHKIGDTIYYNSFGEIKNIIVANVIIDSTDNPIYEDIEGNTVFEKDLIEQKSTGALDKMLEEISKFKIEKDKWYLCTAQYCNCIEGRIYKASLDGRIIDDYGTEYDMHTDAYKWFRPWTIQDARDGDVLTTLDYILIFEKLLSKDGGVSHCHYDFGSLTPQFNFNKDDNWYFGKEAKVQPATKEQRELLFQKMHEAGYEWDAEKKELKKIEQKLADNIESKFKVKYAGGEYNVFEIKDITGVIYYGIEDEPNHIDYVKAENCEIISGYGIKGNGCSFPTKPVMFSEWSEEKNRYTWKPSDEQMEALSAMTRYCNIATSFDAHKQRVVESLCQDLKKLREE